MFAAFLFLNHLNCHAQNKINIDSLHNIVNTSEDNIKIADAYLNIGRNLHQTNQDSAMAFYYKALSTLDKCYYCKGKNILKISAPANANIGFIYKYHFNDIKKSTPYLKKAYSHYKRSNNNESESKLLIELGELYEQINDYKKAEIQYTKAFKIASNSNIEDLSINSSVKIVNTYSKTYSLYRSIRKLEKSLLVYNRYEKTRATSYYELGKLYSELENYKKAINKFIDSKSLWQSLNNNYEVSFCNNNIAHQYLFMKDYIGAIDIYNELLLYQASIGDSLDIAFTHSFIGACYNKLNMHDSANIHLKKSIDYDIQNNTNNGLDTKYWLIAKNHSDIEQYQKAILYYKESLKYRADKNIENNYYEIAKNYAALNNIDSSIYYFNKTIPIYYQKGDLEAIASCNLKIGWLLHESNNHDDTRIYVEKALEYYKRVGDRNKEIECYDLLSMHYSQLFQYTKAINCSNKSIETCLKIHDYERVAISYQSVGLDNYNQGNLNEAIINYQKSLMIFDSLKMEPEKAICLSNIGLVYDNLKLNEEALEYHNKALTLYKKNNDREGELTYYINTTRTYSNIGDNKSAIKSSLKALELAKELNDRETISSAYHNVGILHEKPDSALAYLKLSLKTANNVHQRVLSNIGIVRHYISTIERQPISSETKQCIDSGLFYNKFALEYAPKTKSLKHELDALDNMVTLYSFLENSDSTYTYALKSLGIVKKQIAEAISITYKTDKFITYANSYWEQYYSSAVIPNKTNSKIASEVYNERLYINSLALFSRIGFNRYISNIDSINNFKNSNSFILDEYYGDKKNTNSKEYDWISIKKKLKINEVAIEFIVFPYYNQNMDIIIQYCALIIDSKSETPIMLPIFKESELKNSNINNFNPNSKLAYRQRGAIVATTKTEENKISSIIWGKVDSSLSNKSKIYYSPSGLLNRVSFASLPYNDSLLLSDKYELVQLISTKTILEKKTPFDFKNCKVTLFGGLNYNTDTTKLQQIASGYSKTEPDMFALRNMSINDSLRGGTWNYLQGTMTEAENINNMFKANNISTTLYSGSEGVEEAFKALSGNNSPEIIHIATHGFFFPDPEKKKREPMQLLGVEPVFQTADNPLLRSGLIMAGGNNAWQGKEIPEGVDDGILTAYEISNMNLFNTKLVVLSACETGLGDIKGSEGVYGLQRAFKMAGVENIIMSLWQVPDKETAEFMELFYSKLLESNNIGTSFRETQKIMRNKYEPYYWAAFVLLE